MSHVNLFWVKLSHSTSMTFLRHALQKISPKFPAMVFTYSMWHLAMRVVSLLCAHPHGNNFPLYSNRRNATVLNKSFPECLTRTSSCKWPHFTYFSHNTVFAWPSASQIVGHAPCGGVVCCQRGGPPERVFVPSNCTSSTVGGVLIVRVCALSNSSMASSQTSGLRAASGQAPT